MSKAEKTYGRSLAKGLLAGLIGGLVATAAKSLAERIYPPRMHGEPEPPPMLAEKLAGHALHGGEKTAAEEAIHWGFGVSTAYFWRDVCDVCCGSCAGAKPGGGGGADGGVSCGGSGCGE